MNNVKHVVVPIILCKKCLIDCEGRNIRFAAMEVVAFELCLDGMALFRRMESLMEISIFLHGRNCTTRLYFSKSGA